MKFPLSRHFIAALTATATAVALNGDGAHVHAASSNEMEHHKQDLHLQRHLRAANAAKPAKPSTTTTIGNITIGLKCTTQTNSTGAPCCLNPVGAYVSALATNSTNATGPLQGWTVTTGNGGCAEVCLPDCAAINVATNGN